MFGLLQCGTWIALLATAPAQDRAKPARANLPRTDAAADLSAALEETRAAHQLPALAAAVLSGERLLAEGVAGVRALGSPQRATLDDLWHVGSITKSFTSTLAAVLVARGDCAWEDPLGEVLGVAADTAYESVTLSMLAHHASGLPANPPQSWFTTIRSSTGSATTQRWETVADLLESKPTSAPGTAFLYSNAGYMTLGAALEELSGEPWEELLREHVLDPLELESAGFGAPGSARRVDQPRGHLPGPDGALTAIPPGPNADNPAALGPAGTLHMSVRDLGRYAQEHLRGELGEGSLLDQEAHQALHRGGLGNYACGWVDQPMPWAGGRRVVWHNGSNTMWYAMVALVPGVDRILIVVSNGGIGAQAGVDAALQKLAAEWIPGD